MDVNFALGLEAWAVAEGLSVDTSGHVEARILRALRALASVAGYGGLMHFNNEVLVLLAQIAAAAGGGGAGVVGLLAASGVSAGSTYEVTTTADPCGAGVLQLKRVKNFPTGRTIAAASPEYGWSWINRSGVFTSADDDTTNDGESTWVHNTTSVDWFGGTRTAPIRYREVSLASGQTIDIVCRVKSTSQRDFEFAGPIVFDIATPSNWTRAVAGYNTANGGLLISAGDTSGAGTEDPLTATDVNTNGVWIWMRWSAFGYSVHYSVANQSAPPTSWTLLKRGITASSWGGNTADGKIGVGMLSQNVNTSGGFTTRWLYWRVDIVERPPFPSGFEWGTELFSTSATEQLVGEMDFGSAVELDQTRLRQFLADATNTRAIDTATVTYSVVGGSSSGPASGTYYAAGSVVVSGSYRYWRVYAKIASATGVEQGSVKLPLVLPVSMA